MIHIAQPENTLIFVITRMQTKDGLVMNIGNLSPVN